MENNIGKLEDHHPIYQCNCGNRFHWIGSRIMLTVCLGMNRKENNDLLVSQIICMMTETH